MPTILYQMSQRVMERNEITVKYYFGDLRKIFFHRYWYSNQIAFAPSANIVTRWNSLSICWNRYLILVSRFRSFYYPHLNYATKKFRYIENRNYWQPFFKFRYWLYIEGWKIVAKPIFRRSRKGNIFKALLTNSTIQ